MGRMRLTTALTLCALLAIAAKASVTASGAGVATATLKKIASQVDERAGVISIEASEPVAYVAAQPDPREFVVELRDVAAAGFADAGLLDSDTDLAPLRERDDFQRVAALARR